MAVWIATLREPIRGAVEGLPEPDRHPAPFAAFFAELLTILPPLTLIGAARGGTRALLVNLAGLAVTIAVVIGLHAAGEPWMQWIAIGIGVYAIFSWACALKRRDSANLCADRRHAGVPVYRRRLWPQRLPRLCGQLLGGALRHAHARAGARQGGLADRRVGGGIGVLGVTIGGIVADRLHRANPAGRLLVVIFGAVVPVPFVAIAFTAHSLAVFVPCFFVAG